jgi:hypothetical protein
MSKFLIGIFAAMLFQQSAMATEVMDVKPGNEAYLNVIGMSLAMDVEPIKDIQSLPDLSKFDSVIGMAVVDDVKPVEGLNLNIKTN